jgi:hypothetical protein
MKDYESYDDVPLLTKLWFIPLGLVIWAIVSVWESWINWRMK